MKFQGAGYNIKTERESKRKRERRGKKVRLETIGETRKARSKAPKYRARKRRKGRAFEASLVPLGIARFCYGEFCHGGRDPTCKHPCGQELRFGIRRR